MNEWQEISTAPKDGTIILCARIDPMYRPSYAVAWYCESSSGDGSYWLIDCPGDQSIKATHWQPIPKGLE